MGGFRPPALTLQHDLCSPASENLHRSGLSLINLMAVKQNTYYFGRFFFLGSPMMTH